MSNAVSKVFVFLLLVLTTFLWVGYSVTGLTGGEKKAANVVEVSPEGGEAIYWGKGRCYTCHSMGGQGSAVRGPNHGQFGDKFPLPMGGRAVERAKDRKDKTGQPFTATDYLVESLADPGAFLVEGYKNEMAVVFAPPISLSLDEIKAVISYLQSQGGDVDIDALNNPSGISKKFYDKIQAAAAAGGGDPGHGAAVFKDTCAFCHMVKGGEKPGLAGPDLSEIGKRGIKYISEAILRPTKAITKGFETHVVTDKNGGLVTGLKTRETPDEIDIAKIAGEVVTIRRVEIKEITQDPTRSLMPDDLSEAMTVKDFQDVLSYMIMQKGE